MQITSNLLRLEDFSENSSVSRGATIDRQIKITNAAEQSVEISIWINPTNSFSLPLQRWCKISVPPTVVLKGEDSIAVTLTFEIPLQASPGTYNYDVCIETTNEYPAKQLTRPQQLQVLPSDQSATFDNTPRFTTQPATSPTGPHKLQAGQPFNFTMQVENRSKRVDRFKLLCPDLESQWTFQPKYFQSSSNPVQQTVETDGLELLPGQVGAIQASLCAPEYTPAGYYQPTIRLTSSVTEDLVLLDVLYLEILPNVNLEISMFPAVRHIPEEPKTFEIKLVNQGNIVRELRLQGWDQEKLFAYTFDLPKPIIDRGQLSYITLVARPKKWWRRPFWGKGLQFPFTVDLKNAESEAPELEAKPLALPASPEGTIVWQARPLWHLLLLVLLALGLLGTIAYIIWRVLFWTNPPSPTPPLPEVVSFEAASATYQEGKNTPVRLDWEISYLNRVQKVTIVQLQENVEINRKSYSFLPDKGAFCRISTELRQRRATGGNIDCDKLPSIAQRQNYPNGELKENNFCEEVLLSEIPQQSSPEPSPSPSSDSQTPSLDELDTTLRCQRIITSASQSGDSVFRIEVFANPEALVTPAAPQSRWQRWFGRRSPASSSAQNPEQPIATLTTDTIRILPPEPEPVVVSFFSTQPTYEEVGPPLSPSTNPDSSPRPKPGPIQLNWEIANPQQIKELRLVNLAPDGSVDRELRRYSVNDGVPTELRQYCAIATNLVCRNLPTNIEAVGEYRFKLVVVPLLPPVSSASTSQPAQTVPEIAAITPSIKIQARPPEIITFLINGQNVLENPRQVYVINPARGPIELSVNWSVIDGEAQLLPAPGSVLNSGSITSPISVPGQQIITLQVTNESGEQVTRTAEISVMEATPPPQTQSDSAQPTPDAPSPNPLGVPSDPNGLPPFELPPQLN
ncbi:hypothetical protein H6F95_07720 [Cyanobacteria bacterium FACHB-471]|nr:hypothetical protein [Cyanobacteria bacterium FACHB-471]